MPIRIAIQAGHWHAQPPRSKGAPGEVEFTVDVANSVSAELRLRGFNVKETDSYADQDPDVTTVDWDCFLAIHYDSDIYNRSGGFVDFADPSSDAATQESQRIAKTLSEEYFRVTKIENHPERSNNNTRFYYMWQYLTAKTPCVLIECGVGWRNPDDHTLFTEHREMVVEGIVRGLCKAFNVPYDSTPVPPTDPCIEVKNKLTEMTKERDYWKNLVTQIKALLP